MKIFILLFCLSPLFIGAQTSGFVIEGRIKSIPENTEVLLMDFNGKDTIAKTKVHDSLFVLKGKVDNIDARTILFPELQKRMVVFSGNEQIYITGNSEFSDINITGSPANYDYDEFLYDIKPLNDFVDYYRQQVQSAPTKAFRDSSMIMLNTAYNMYQNSIDRFLSRKKNSPVAALILAYSYDTDPNKDVLLLEKRFNMLEGDATKSQFAKNISEVIARDKIGSVGTQALDFTQKDTEGKDVSLSQFKGKYVLIDFWASWCRPCRLQNPSIVEAYNKFKKNNFAILGVSLDKEKDKWLQAIRADHLTWTNVSDLKFWNNDAAMLYNIHEIPQNILVDPDGKIIAKRLDGGQLNQKLQEIFK